MKLDMFDARALSELSPTAVTAYLLSGGWVQVRVEHGFDVFCKQIDGEEMELEVSFRQDARDYPSRVLDLLENLTLFENRSQYDIYLDIVRGPRLHHEQDATSSKTTLMEIVNAAAERFDKCPEYRASIGARAELQSGQASSQPATPAATTTEETRREATGGNEAKP